MSIKDIFPALQDYCFHEEDLKNYTSFRIGGPAEVLIKPKSKNDLIKIWEKCKENNISLTILGDGSNVLVSDNGIRGVVVITNGMNKIEIKENCRVYAEAGARLSKVAETACINSLKGLEFASGIPGTIGGAVYMNAGAYGHDISEFCETVTLLNSEGEIIFKPANEMNFDYRKSYAAENNVIILGATLKLSQGNMSEIREEMKTLNKKRKDSQPLDKRSAGSTFKRPKEYFAGKLIEESGLKGFNIGDAKVSEKHAGFVINDGNATAKDVVQLMEFIAKKVYENYNVKLEPEVRILGG